jgi:hypothetical protein
MDVSNKEKYALDKVALLVIFALGLLLAQLLVSAKSRLRLSEPLELPYAGISVRIPQGNGWHGENDWQFISNTFTISSVFSPITGKIAASVEVRYLIAPQENRPDRQINRYSKELAGIVIETGKIRYTDVLVEWTHIKIPDKYLDVFLGATQLPNGRGLSIEVQGPSSDAGWMEEIFTGTAKAVSFDDNYLLENGRKIVEKLKTSGLAELTLNHNQQRFFLIEDEKKQILGFMTDLLTISTDKEASGSVKFAELHHIRTRQGSLGRHSLFQGDQKLRQFLWFSKAGSLEAIGETTVQIELNEENQMTVKAYTPLVSRNYTIGPAAIPEIFLEELIGLFVESRITEALIDLILSDGRIIPIRLSAVDPRQPDADQAAYIVRLDFLDQQGYYGQIYLDNNKKTFKTMVHREDTYIFQRSNKDEVLKYFPMWRDYFLQMEKQDETP